MVKKWSKNNKSNFLASFIEIDQLTANHSTLATVQRWSILQTAPLHLLIILQAIQVFVLLFFFGYKFCCCASYIEPLTAVPKWSKTIKKQKKKRKKILKSVDCLTFLMFICKLNHLIRLLAWSTGPGLNLLDRSFTYTLPIQVQFISHLAA